MEIWLKNSSTISSRIIRITIQVGKVIELSRKKNVLEFFEREKKRMKRKERKNSIFVVALCKSFSTAAATEHKMLLIDMEKYPLAKESLWQAHDINAMKVNKWEK